MKKIITIIIGILVLAGGAAYIYMQNMDAKMAEAIKTMTAPTEQVNANTNLFTLAQIAEHTTRDNCWLSIEDKVYNVTSFVDMHPGGDKILSGCGKDATEMFNKVRAHAKTSVVALKEKFFIGNLSK